MGNVIIFDFDGVIENTYDFCYEIEKDRNSGLNHDIFKSFYCGNYWDCVDKEHISKESIDSYESKYRNEIQKRNIDPQIKQALEEVSRKHKLFIVSSCSEQNIQNYLKQNKINHLFVEILGRETHYSKIEKFKMIFEKYEISAKDCVFITDTLGDILEANNVNMKTLAVTWGYHDEFLLRKGEPYKIINSASEVLFNIR